MPAFGRELSIALDLGLNGRCQRGATSLSTVRHSPSTPACAREGSVLGVIFSPQKRAVVPTWSSPRGTAATLFCSKPMQRALRTGKRTLAHFSPADTIWLSFRRTNSPSDRGRHASRLSGTLATNTTRCACDSTVTPLVTVSASAAGIPVRADRA